MTDERFWHIYFTLVRKYLPDRAYSWAEGDALPVKPGESWLGARTGPPALDRLRSPDHVAALASGAQERLGLQPAPSRWAPWATSCGSLETSCSSRHTQARAAAAAAAWLPILACSLIRHQVPPARAPPHACT
jgi:hypothetical protein